MFFFRKIRCLSILISRCVQYVCFLLFTFNMVCAMCVFYSTGCSANCTSVASQHMFLKDNAGCPQFLYVITPYNKKTYRHGFYGFVAFCVEFLLDFCCVFVVFYGFVIFIQFLLGFVVFFFCFSRFLPVLYICIYIISWVFYLAVHVFQVACAEPSRL